MSRTAADCIAELLGRLRPSRLLVVGGVAGLPAPYVGAAETQHVAAQDAAIALAECGRFDFAIVAELIERLDEQAATVLLGRLKNLHVDRFLLLVDPRRASLDSKALLALALAPLEQLHDGREAWLYDIDRYNPEREWNNPEDWAHPENFRKYRW